MLLQWKDKSIKTYLSALSGESSSLFSSITGIGIGFLGFFSADFNGFFFKLLSTDGVSEVAAEPDTPLSRMISGTALNEGWSFLRSMVGISSSPVSEESESPPASLGGSSSGVVSAEQNEVTGQSCMKKPPQRHGWPQWSQRWSKAEGKITDGLFPSLAQIGKGRTKKIECLVRTERLQSV